MKSYDDRINTPLNENCSAIILKKLPKKLGDPGKFLIPCDFSELEKCMALADLGASINLMPLSVWKKFMLLELVPTRMTLELANRSVAYPAGIVEDVFVQVGRPFLRTARALVDVHREELILRVGDEKLTFKVDSTSKYSHKYGKESINMIDIFDSTCEDHFHEVLKFQKSIHPLSGNPTPSSDLVVASLSPSLTPFGDSDFLLEETDTLLSHFDHSLPYYEAFCFHIDHQKEKRSDSTTSHSDHSLLDYEAFCFYINHHEEKCSGSIISHSDPPLLQYESFYFDLSIGPPPIVERSNSHHEEFADELAHIISPPEYDHFYFDIEIDPGELTRLLKKNRIPSDESKHIISLGKDFKLGRLLSRNGGNQLVQNAVQNPGVQNGVTVVPGIAHQNRNSNFVAARAEGNANGNNGNQIRCYNCRGLGHLARNCTVRPRRRDAAYLQTQLLITQKEEAGIQLQAGEFDLMAAAADLDEIKEVNTNCILMANLQQASTSGTQSDNAPVYNTDGSAEVQLHENCYKNEIFNRFTQEEQYTELLEPIPEPHQVPQNDSNVISKVSSMDQGRGKVEQHSANVEETRAYHESLFHNLATEVKKVNSVNRKMKEKNVELTTELARYKNQERCFEISQEKYDKLERCYQQSVYQEQCLSKKINALYLSSGKQITALNKEISNLNKQLSKEKSTVSSLQEEKKRLKSDFKIHEDELLDKQIQLENKVKELDNILIKIADESLTKHKALELEIERLLRAVVSQDIMSIVQNNSVVDTSNLQTELDRTKERFENCIIKKENEYAKLWNDWYKKCEEYTLDPLFQKLENENMELEFQIRNYEKGNAHLKAVYKNLFDSINVTRTQTKTIIDSLQNKLHDTIYENAKLRAQLFDKVSEQKDTTRGTSANTKFAMQSILAIPPSSSRPKLYVVTSLPKSMAIPKVGEMNALSNQVTSNQVPSSQEFKVVENDNVIVPRMFRIDPSNTSRENKFVPIHNVRASVWTNPITMSQPHVISKKVVNSDSNGFSSTGVDITTKTRRPQPRSNTKNDRVPSASQSSCIKNKEVEVEEHHRNLLLSKNPKPMSSECNNIKLAIRNDKSEVVCAMCKKCLITANHDVCVLNYVNGMKPRGKKQKAKVSNIANQMKHKPQVWKPKNVGPKERLASPKPSKPRMCLRWSPTGKMFDFKGKLIASSESNGYPNMFMVRRLGLFQAYDRESKASHQLRLEVLGNRSLWE
ncbi:retrovirus-related pol polyprotein from transposon TNT 1-94 [Tanacetum coccineum]